VIIASGACEVIWLRNFLKEFAHPQLELAIIYVNNKLAIQLVKNPMMHERNKHIEFDFTS
jgi:hypothetical protein